MAPRSFDPFDAVPALELNVTGRITALSYGGTCLEDLEATNLHRILFSFLSKVEPEPLFARLTVNTPLIFWASRMTGETIGCPICLFVPIECRTCIIASPTGPCA